MHVSRDPSHEECWAKTSEDGSPGISVRSHCLNVGCVAEALLEHATWIDPRAATLAALHDVGKVSPGFQRKCEKWLHQRGLADRALNECWSVRESDHAKLSQQTVQELLGNSRLYPWSAAVGAHHGRIKGRSVRLREDWESERERLARELIDVFGPLPDHAPDAHEAMVWAVAGLITVADWIGSDETEFPQDADWSLEQRREHARSALHSIGWGRPSIRSLSGFTELFPNIARPNGLQAAVMDVVREPGVYVVEGPMGCGKTEAALAAAYQLIESGKASGLYFALPTQATSNRIHLRVQRFIDLISDEPSSVRLAHAGSWLMRDDTPLVLRPAYPTTSPTDSEAADHVRAGRSWFASAKRALLTTYGVGTIDQALLGIVAATHFFVRQFALAGKVVVLDEVHTYDLYTGTLVDALVRRLRDLDCTILILSATLTQSRRRELLGADDHAPLSGAYPLLSVSGPPVVEVPCEPPAPKSVAVNFAEPSVLVATALDCAQAGRCVLWVRNTVDEAQGTFRSLKSANRDGGPEIALLHSRFPFFRREQLEEDWMERLGRGSPARPNGCVLVSTQIAEQSVDVDADLLITDLAPTDMLLQRIGRLWRHDRNRPASWSPEVWIHAIPLSDDQLAAAAAKDLKHVLGKSARVYAPYVLLRSLVEWRRRRVLTLPGDVRVVLEATYAEPDPAEPAGWRVLRLELEKERTSLAELADSTTRVWSTPNLPDEEGIQTRRTSLPTAEILLVRDLKILDRRRARLTLLEDGSEILADARTWSFEAAKAIHRNLARVPRWAVAGALDDAPGWLTNHVRRPAAVGRLLPGGGIAWPGGEAATGLSYHADQGIVINRDRQSTSRTLREEFEEDESYD